MFTHLCDFCHKRLSLGNTPLGWLGCVVCQAEVDKFMLEFVRQKFGVNSIQTISSEELRRQKG